jgi:lipoprotein-anchoring transpeptidase ErfK/SrfK
VASRSTEATDSRTPSPTDRPRWGEGELVRISKIVVGLVAVLAVGGGLAACSSGTSDSAASQHIAVAADLNTQQAKPATPSTSDPVTTAAPTTTTTTVTPTTTTPPTTTKPATTTKKKPVSSVPCSAAAKACVDLSERKAWLVDDGKIVYGPVSIMSGRTGWPTPIGTFHVTFKDADYVSHEFKVPMPDAVFFYPGIAFHEGSLYAHSHGCIHLSRTSASKFFHSLSSGDEVQVLR